MLRRTGSCIGIRATANGIRETGNRVDVTGSCIGVIGSVIAATENCIGANVTESSIDVEVSGSCIGVTGSCVIVIGSCIGTSVTGSRVGAGVTSSDDVTPPLPVPVQSPDIADRRPPTVGPVDRKLSPSSSSLPQLSRVSGNRQQPALDETGSRKRNRKQ